MLAASNQMMRWSLSLIWPCQHIGGVRIRSPSCMSQRRPLTMVAAPSARVAKRIAAKVCRCGRARSPGSSTVKAAIRFEVVTVSPPKAGLTRISARRSTSSIGTSDDRALGERLDVAPAPDQRRVLGLRLDRRERAEAIPQRMQVGRLQLGDEVALLCGGSDIGHGRRPQVFGSFASMLVLSMMTCLMNTCGSTLSPLR